MFTGLVETLGTLDSLVTTASGSTRVTVAAPALRGRWHTGDSIAVNGVCLTALPVSETAADASAVFAADLAQETLERTSLGSVVPGSVVNLELPTPAGAPLGGHVVQGHVDATATLVSLTPLHPEAPDATDWRLTLALPPQLSPFVLSQGSITVDGISLTVARAHEPTPEGTRIEIAIIPHTYRSTNLHALLPGAKVNIETDVLSRYATQQAATPAVETEWLTTELLLANGY